MIVAFYILTLIVLILCTVGIVKIANPKTDKEIWSIIGCLLLINAFSYWMGVLID